MSFKRPLAVAVAVLAFVAAVSAPAHAAGGVSDKQVRAIIARINETGRLSDTDRTSLMTRPEIASVLVDPESGVLKDDSSDVVGTVAAGDAQLASASAAYATRSRSVDRYIQYTSITGATVLNYHFTVYWTYNGSTVTSTPTRGHYIRTSAPSVYDRGFTNNVATANLPGPYAYTVTLQANWEQCILKYGCIVSGNPFSRFGVYFDGTYSIVQRL